MGEFQRETRYIVFKVKDFDRFSTSTERAIVERLAQQIDFGRATMGKAPLECVVVENDWPEYETVWKMIEARVSGATPAPTDSANGEKQ